MTSNNTKKYRLWGLGALILLIIVIIFAIAMIASVAKKTPKANTNTPTTSQEQKADDKKNTNENKEKSKEETNAEKKGVILTLITLAMPHNNTPAENKQATEAENMPTTGPASNLLTIFLISASAYLFALNASWIKRGSSK